MNITFLYCVAELPDTTNKEVVKVMHQFFEHQVEIAIGDEIRCRCEYNAMVAANEAANRELLASGDLGWSKLPYNEIEIKNAKRHAEIAKENLIAHKAILNYFMGKIFEQIS